MPNLLLLSVLTQNKILHPEAFDGAIFVVHHLGVDTHQGDIAMENNRRILGIRGRCSGRRAVGEEACSSKGKH